MKLTVFSSVKIAFISGLVATMLSCDTKSDSLDLKPKGSVPTWGPTIKPEMQVVIEKLDSLGGKPIETLEPTQARLQPTPTDAVIAVMKDYNIVAPTPQCDTVGRDIPVTGGTTRIRIYTPKTSAASYPVIVYYHGGGFVIADINVYNSSPQALCEQVNAVVVSVEYPKGPEKKFPAAHTVSFDAYQWVIKNATSLKGDSAKIAVVGESAGANLATNMSIMARDKGIKMPLYQVLVYPVANNDMNSESYVKYANAKPLNKAMMAWFVKHALNSTAEAADPRISLVNANLKGLPKTLVIAAEIDPLQTEGKLLSDKLKAAQVETDYQLYTGVTHEFFGMTNVVPQAKEAQALAAKKLKAALGLQ
jgi:acetyl esterase